MQYHTNELIMNLTYTEDIMKSVLIGFKKNNNLENVFFNLSYYSQRDPPKYFKSKYDTERLKVRINGRERMIITNPELDNKWISI